MYAPINNHYKQPTDNSFSLLVMFSWANYSALLKDYVSYSTVVITVCGAINNKHKIIFSN